MQEKEIIEERWDIKKILIGGFCFIIFLIGTIMIGGWDKKLSKFFYTGSVKGASTQREVSAFISPHDTSTLPITSNLQKQFQSIQQQVSHINISDVASSSPQIQKVIHDIQSLQQYPTNQAKEMCQKICGGI